MTDTTRRRRRSTLAVALMLLALPWMVGATCSDTDKPDETLGLDSGRACKEGAFTAAPYTVSMPGGELVNLTTSLLEGKVVVVRYDCDEGLTVLSGCDLPDGSLYAEYTPAYTGTLLKETRSFSGKDELQGNFSNVYAKVEASARREINLALDTRIIGSMTTTVSRIYKPALERAGGCEGATHFIKSAQIGAYKLDTSSSQAVQASVESMVASASGGASSDTSRGLAAGSFEGCENSDPQVAYELGCSVPVQLQLLPVRPLPPGKTEVPPPQPVNDPAQLAPGCAIPGQVFSDGRCVSPEEAAASGGYICEAPDLDNFNEACRKDEACRGKISGQIANCNKQCKLGNRESCRLLSEVYLHRNTPEDRPTEARSLLQSNCGLVDPHPSSCTRLGMMYLRGEGPVDNPRPEYAARIFKRACPLEGEVKLEKDDTRTIEDLVDGRACTLVGEFYLTGDTFREPNPSQGLRYFERGCAMGNSDSCAGVGEVNYRFYEENPQSFERAWQIEQERLKQQRQNAAARLEQERTQKRQKLGPVKTIAPPSDAAANAEGDAAEGAEGAEGDDPEAAKAAAEAKAKADEAAAKERAEVEAAVEAAEDDAAWEQQFAAAQAKAKAQRAKNGLVHDSAFEAKVHARLRQACFGGSAKGCFLLGRVYERGLGLKNPARDRSKAEIYYEQACTMGSAQACLRRGEMAYRRQQVLAEKDMLSAVENYRKACFGVNGDWPTLPKGFALPYPSRTIQAYIGQEEDVKWEEVLKEERAEMEAAKDNPDAGEEAPKLDPDVAVPADYNPDMNKVAPSTPSDEVMKALEAYAAAIKSPEACAELNAIQIERTRYDVPEGADDREEGEPAPLTEGQARSVALAIGACRRRNSDGCLQLSQFYLQNSNFNAGLLREGDVEQALEVLGSDVFFEMAAGLFTLSCEEMEDGDACHSIGVDVFEPVVVVLKGRAWEGEEIQQMAESVAQEQVGYFEQACQYSRDPAICLDKVIYAHGSREDIDGTLIAFPDTYDTYVQQAMEKKDYTALLSALASILPHTKQSEKAYQRLGLRVFTKGMLNEAYDLCIKSGYTRACMDVGFLYFTISATPFGDMLIEPGTSRRVAMAMGESDPGASETGLPEDDRDFAKLLGGVRKATLNDIRGQVVPMLKAGCEQLNNVTSNIKGYKPEERRFDGVLSCTLLAFFNQAGVGVAQNQDEAFTIFRRICRDFEHPFACNETGSRYASGKALGGDRNYYLASLYFDKASENARGYRDPLAQEGQSTAQEKKDEIQLLVLDSTCGNNRISLRKRTEACFEAAAFIRESTQELPDEQVRTLPGRACAVGDPVACSQIALQTIDSGRFNTRNARLVVDQLEYACEPRDSNKRLVPSTYSALEDAGDEKLFQARADACHRLGLFYSSGYPAGSPRAVIKRDGVLAFKYLNLSCERSRAPLPRGCNELAQLYEFGDGTATNHQKATDLYHRGCVDILLRFNPNDIPDKTTPAFADFKKTPEYQTLAKAGEACFRYAELVQNKLARAGDVEGDPLSPPILYEVSCIIAKELSTPDAAAVCQRGAQFGASP